MRSTRSARAARRQQSRPTASRRVRWAGSTGTTPQPTSSQIKITPGLASSSAVSSSSGQSSSPAKTGRVRASSGVPGHLGGAVPGLLQHVVQLALARAADNQNHNSTSSLCPTAAQSTIPSSHSWRKNPARSPVTPPNCRRAVTT